MTLLAGTVAFVLLEVSERASDGGVVVRAEVALCDAIEAVSLNSVLAAGRASFMASLSSLSDSPETEAAAAVSV